AADLNYWNTGVDNAPLHGLATGVDGGNGVYLYSSSPTFPNNSFSAANYWVDVDFVGSAGATATPTATATATSTRTPTPTLAATNTPLATNTPTNTPQATPTTTPTGSGSQQITIWPSTAAPIHANGGDASSV